MLFNNAGIAIVKRILDLSEEEIRRTLDVNLTSHFWVCYYYTVNTKLESIMTLDKLFFQLILPVFFPGEQGNNAPQASMVFFKLLVLEKMGIC